MLKIRKVNTTYRIPFVYGNYAEHIVYDDDIEDSDRHTHKWTLYIRGLNGEDISYYIRKVEFKLHESFENPIRTVAKFPFELSETGWGEFSIQMKLFFVDSVEKPVTVTHNLTLFDHKDLPNTLRVELYKNGVKSEYYDELIFQDPTMEMVKILEENHGKSLPIKDKVDCFYTKEYEEALMAEFDALEADILAELQHNTVNQ